jgi:hypothetical protein
MVAWHSTTTKTFRFVIEGEEMRNVYTFAGLTFALALAFSLTTAAQTSNTESKQEASPDQSQTDSAGNMHRDRVGERKLSGGGMVFFILKTSRSLPRFAPRSRRDRERRAVSHRTDLDVPANIRQAEDENISCVEQTDIAYNCDDRFDGFHFTPFLKRNSSLRIQAKLRCVVACSRCQDWLHRWISGQPSN